MKFSVLLSLYIKENPSYLKQSIDSILSQTLQPDEIVLVEDGPLTPELESIVNNYVNTLNNLIIVRLKQNMGLGKALNEGLKHCSYDIVARMDTDDIAKTFRFEKQIGIFKKYQDIDVCSAWIDEFENDVNYISGIRKIPEKDVDIKAFAKSRCPINHPVVMFKKQSVLNAGNYLHFPLYEDYYLWMRMIKNGAKFYNIQESLLYFRTSPESFKRRGGIKYAITEVRFQKELFNMGMISTPMFIKNIIIRFPIRIAPNFIRTFIYKKIIRSNNL